MVLKEALARTAISMALALGIIAATVLPLPAMAATSSDGTAQPASSEDLIYLFYFDYEGATYASSSGWKENMTPSYIDVWHMTIWDAYLYIDRLVPSTGNWVNETSGGYAYLVEPAQYWIHNTVYESANGPAHCRLTGWSPDEVGELGGEWSADSIYVYPSLNPIN